MAGGPGHPPVRSPAVVRGPGQPVRTPAGAGVQGCLFTRRPLRGSRVAALPLLHLRATRSTACSHARFREGSGPSCSLTRFREGSRGRLSAPCLHKGTIATESVWGSVCITAVLSRGPVRTATTTCNGAPAPSAPPPPRPETEDSRVGPNGTVQTRTRVNTGSAFFAPRQTAKPRCTCLDGRLSLLRRQVAAYAAALVYNIAASPAERAPRVGGPLQP